LSNSPKKGIELKDWDKKGSEVHKAIGGFTEEMLSAYRANPSLVDEHAGQELETAAGGYGSRQVFELIQNAADQLEGKDGRIEVVLTENSLYCANSGRPFGKAGLRSILHAYLSDKDDDQIGRFGLGFKSVLGVTRSPLVLTRSGSFRFGEDVASAIAETVPGCERYPLLRLASPVVAADHFRADPVAREFSKWAATIVVLPLASHEEAPWLASDIRNFPQAFLAFAEHVGELHLEDRVEGYKRAFTATRTGRKVTVDGDSDPMTWHVFESEVHLDKEARERAGKLADRANVTVKWAVSDSEGSTLGSFWSYFPTDDETTLRGVLNAPWQLREDRRGLVSGPYNEVLLKGVAALVGESIEFLNTDLDDPSSFLELLPGRGREPRCWADGVLTNETNRLLASGPSIPLQEGGLELPAAAHLHPAGIPAVALKIWLDYADVEGWVDHGVDRQKDRRARVERYIENAPTSSIPTVDDWFLAMAPSTSEPLDPARSIAMIKVADLVRSEGLEIALESHPFVLTEDGSISALGSDLTLPGAYAAPVGTLALVHADVAADAGAFEALRRLGVEETSVDAELNRLLVDAQPEADEDWEYFWSIVRRMPAERASAMIKGVPEFEPRVRTQDGAFRRILVSLLPGRCVPSNSASDRNVVIDDGWHRQEINLLRLLGCVSGPERDSDPTLEPWFSEYEDELIGHFMNRNSPASPSRESIEIVPGSSVPGPLTSLRALSAESKARLSQVAIELMEEVGPWIAKHPMQKYKAVRAPNPAVWFIRGEGLLETPLGPREPAGCVGPALRAGGLAPAVTCSSEVAEALGLPQTWGEVDGEVFATVLERSLEAEVATALELYEQLVAEPEIEVPEKIRCWRHGSPEVAPPSEVAASSDPALTGLLTEGHNCVLPVSEESRKLFVDQWGLLDAADLVARRIAPAAVGERTLVTDAFPPLKKRLDLADRDLELQPCEEIRIVEEVLGGTKSREVEHVRDGNILFYEADVNDQGLLRIISMELGLGMGPDDISRVIQGVATHLKNEQTKKVRKAKTDAERLLVLLGPERIEARLPVAVRKAYASIYGEPNELGLAELAMSVHGVDVLKVHKDDLEELGFVPPRNWGGSRKAREFVQSFSFPPQLAGFETENRPPTSVVEARPSIPALHDYQLKIVGEMRELFSRDKDNRAMLTLPTGAGKTRVAVEGVMDAISQGLLSRDLILWVAQSDELCEQAVQAWSELWRAADMEDQLTLSRLWTVNEAEPVTVGVHVVVATIDKLSAIQARETSEDDYGWIRDAGAVVVDEAHRSISKTYTQLFRWLSLDRNKFGAPLVGLSATPYRGRSKEETDRLVKRYGDRRLDHVLGADDHYPMLQEMKVISKVRHETLPGSDVELSPDQLDRLNKSGMLPTEAGITLGADTDRTARVIESITSQPDEWPILVFAPSVENAQALAGLLEHQGIPSAAISGETPAQARRWYVREFRRGNLRVLTNYGVFAEGFDAPSVRAVYITRPVFSPNSYQQMIGRGLRGPLNGGKEECLIVDVADNVVNFDESLAFVEFEHLWNKEPSTAGTQD
jgi:superfamily II DNA or RNA helicase